MSFLSAIKDEIVTVAKTRVAYLALGVLIGAGGNAKKLLDVVMSLGGF